MNRRRYGGREASAPIDKEAQAAMPGGCTRRLKRPNTGIWASVPRHGAVLLRHPRARQICPTISHQPTSAKIRPKLSAIANSANR